MTANPAATASVSRTASSLKNRGGVFMMRILGVSSGSGGAAIAD
jgi:hypothetical protein